MKRENLQIHPTDFRKIFQPPAGRSVLGDCLTGRWYRLTVNKMKKCDEDMIIPIIIFTDKTHIDASGRVKLDPAFGTLGIFTRAVREQSYSWRPIGMKDEEHYTKVETAIVYRKRFRHQNDHDQWKVITQSIKDCQKSGALNNIMLTIGSETRCTNIKCPIMYISCDMQEADKICGKNQNYSYKGARCSYLCDYPGDKASEYNYKCKFNIMKEMIATTESSTAEELALISMKKIDNAFFQLDFGANPHGVYLACAPDIMHTVEEGVIKHAIAVLVNEFLTNDQCTYLDDHARSFYSIFRQSGKKEFPRCSFPNGFTNLSQLKAHEQVGILFLIVLILGLEESKQKFHDKWPNDRYSNVLHTFESLLCFHASINRDTFWHVADDKSAEQFLTSIRLLIKKMVLYLPRAISSSEWNVPKLHALLHLVISIIYWGAPKNYSTSTGERLHSLISKPAGHRSQKRQKTFNEQAGKRIVDSLVLNLVNDKFSMYDTHTKEKQTSNGIIGMFEGSSTCVLSVSDVGEASYNIAKLIFPIMESQSFIDNLRERTEVEFPLAIFTKYNMTTTHGIPLKIRANGTYQSAGEWYDWVLVKYEKSKKGQKSETVNIPAKVYGFVLLNEKPFAIIHPCDYHHRKLSVLLVQWSLHMTKSNVPRFDLISCDSIVSHCFIYPDKNNKVIQVIEKQEWSRCFTTAFDKVAE